MKFLIALGFRYSERAIRAQRGRERGKWRGPNHAYYYVMAAEACWTLAGAMTPNRSINDLHDAEA